MLGASPDGIVRCECRESGLLEIKFSWTQRQISDRLHKIRRELFRGHRQCNSIKKITQLLLSGANAAGSYWLKFDTEIHIKLFFNIPFEKFQRYTVVIYFNFVPRGFCFFKRGQ